MLLGLEETAQLLVAEGKGILAADETPATLTRRFDALSIHSTPESRRQYREMLFTTRELHRYIAATILSDETIHQTDMQGTPMAELLLAHEIIPGIKVDRGAKPLAACPGETVTEGLDGLRERLAEYVALGARFAKWRAVIHVGDHLPSDTCIEANAHALARYAALCQEAGLVPIVEPEVLMNGAHSLALSEWATARVLARVFAALRSQRVILEGMLLKPNMVVPGVDSPERASVREVAETTLRVLRETVPPAVPGIVFLSGGQSEREASEHLAAMARLSAPWRLSFSFGRALQDSAMRAWKIAGVRAGQEALLHRAHCNSEAALGRYDESTEGVALH